MAKRNGKRANGEGSVYKRKDGRWVATWIAQTINGPKRREVYGHTQQETIKSRKRKMSEEGQGIVADAGKTTLGEYINQWLHSCVKDQVSHRTYHNYRSQITNHIVPALGATRLAKLNTFQLQGFYQAKRDSGLSAATVRYIHAVVHRALNQAVSWSLISRNPADGIRLPRLTRKEMRTLTPEESKRLLAAAKGDRLEALYAVAVFCGLRQGELLGLKWEDVDFESGRLKVRRQLQRMRDGSGLALAPTKNSKERVARLGATTIKALKAHHNRQCGEKGRAGDLYEDRGLVFASDVGRPLDHSNVVNRSFKPLLKKAGLPDRRFHDLRHTCGSLMLSTKVPIKVVQETLGHSSITVTMDVYGHVLPDMQNEAADAMDNLLGEGDLLVEA